MPLSRLIQHPFSNTLDLVWFISVSEIHKTIFIHFVATDGIFHKRPISSNFPSICSDHGIDCGVFYSYTELSHWVMSDSLQSHGLQHIRLPCPSLYPRVCSNVCPFSWWCHPTISSSVTPLLLPSIFPSIRVFPMSQFFASGGQSTGASALASVLLVNIQDWFPLGLIGLVSLLSKGCSGVFSRTIVQKHQFCSICGPGLSDHRC